ncbi:MAG: tetraacyldisaccharide 4'-kinase [Proteobacteria bacterium]|nr:tetraacyldisaccharide 4'-kinase [Pseudomonadota bacterium]
MLDKIFFDLWYRKRYSYLIIFLLPLSLIYYLIVSVRNFIYDNFSLSKRLDSKVISIGNINLGGTGKTPFLIYQLKDLTKKYKKILVLSRGYGSKIKGELSDSDGFSDEGRLIKSKFPEIVVWTGKDRIKSYQEYKKKYGLPEIVLLDDGFQHRVIKRDEDIVLINGKLLFGNKLIFPAGPLREPVGSVKKRATTLVVKEGDYENYRKVKEIFPDKEILRFELRESYFVDFRGNRKEENFLKNKDISAFCGIANPYSFFETLERKGIVIKRKIFFSDHYSYTERDIERICNEKNILYITTEKDFVKIKSIWKDKEKLFILINEYELIRGDGL